METQDGAVDYAALIRDFAETIGPLLKQYPASLKYHQCEKGGLAVHTSLVSRLAHGLYRILPDTVYEYNEEQQSKMPIVLKKIDFTQDELFVAALFHDTGKLYDYVANPDGETFRWRLDDDVFFESSILAEMWEKVPKSRRWDTISHLWVKRPFHEILSNEVAKFFFKRNDTPWNAKIENAILCHSGGWSNVSATPKPIAMMLHAADLLGSQF